MAALLETFDNSSGKVKNISSNVFMPSDTLDQPCDVILVVEDDKQVKAHRQVLSEASTFFEKLLNSDMKESKEGTVRLEMFSESVMVATLEFIYAGHVQILTEDNARDLIVIADYLFLQNLKTLAEGVLIQWLNVSNCLSNYHFSEKYHCEELFSKAQTFMLANFSAVYSANPAEVLNMSSGDIEMLVSSDKINVSAEEEVFIIILSWINHDRNKREKYFAELFRHVRLVYVSRDFLCSHVVTNDLVRDKEGFLNLVEDAMKLIESRDFSNLSFKPRNSLQTSVIVIKKDENILCYFPREDEWCHLNKRCGFMQISHTGHPVGLVSCRGKLYEMLESINLVPEHDLNRSWSFQHQLIMYEPFLDKQILLQYTGKKHRHLEQIFVTKQDELYALESEPCKYHGLFWEIQEHQMIQFCGKETHVFFITKYKHESSSWENVSSFDHLDRCKFCIVATDNFIYFIGGEEWENGYPRNVRTDVDRYDLRKDQWRNVADIHEGCRHHWGASVNEKIFIIGQTKTRVMQSQTFLYQCEVYDEARNEWQVIASPPIDGEVREFLAVDGKLYAVAQLFMYKYTSTYVTVQCYDPVQDKWNLKTEMPFSDWRGFIFPCSMRIYKEFLADHQLVLYDPSITPQSLSSVPGSDSLPVLSSLESLSGSTTTLYTSSGKCKCFIM